MHPTLKRVSDRWEFLLVQKCPVRIASCGPYLRKWSNYAGIGIGAVIAWV
jgi:hypothetical protein